MDTDGSLTLLELAALLRSIGLKLSGDQIHSLLATIDANGNGSVEFNELVAAILPEASSAAAEDHQESFSSSSSSSSFPTETDAAKPKTMMNQEQLMEAFSRFDRDGNGVITAAELAGSMAKMGQPLTYKELVEMIREADTDGDGVISFDEFASIMATSAVGYLGQNTAS